MSYGVKLDPHPIAPGLSVRDLVDNHLYAYNAARLREACQLFARKIAEPDVTIGVTLSGALTPNRATPRPVSVRSGQVPQPAGARSGQAGARREAWVS